jgi:hypothetical protein
MRGVYKRALPAAASTFGYIPYRVDLFSIPFFFDYIYRTVYILYETKGYWWTKNTIQNIICRAGPAATAALLHIGDVFSWRNLFGAASLIFWRGNSRGASVDDCKVWKAQWTVLASLYTPPMQYVYTVKELSSIHRSWECGLQQIRTPLADWNLTQYVGSMVYITGTGT